MTSTVTTIKAVRDSDGTNGKPKREHGLAQLRATEARGPDPPGFRGGLRGR